MLFWLTGVIALLGVVVVERAWAAVRVCPKHVTGKVTSAIRERDAKRAAILDWTQKPKFARIPHPGCRIAWLKV